LSISLQGNEAGEYKKALVETAWYASGASKKAFVYRYVVGEKSESSGAFDPLSF
jgi:hypothetical protein